MPAVADIAAELRRIVPEEKRVSTGDSVRRLHAEDVLHHFLHLPDVVVFARDRDEVCRVMAFADREGVPVVPFGAGTSAEGEVVPLQGGISLDLSALDSIEVRPADMQATVGAGARRKALNERAGQHGLWFPVDPGADASLGGMAATNASGTTTVRYGSMRQNVLELEVVLADGRVIRTGSRTVKTSAGYNLAQLFVGSEGTLGVITEVTVRLHGIPERIVALRAAFPDLDAAVACSTALIGSGVGALRVELVDALTMQAINAYRGTDLPPLPHLFIELGGTEEGVEGERATALELTTEHGASRVDAVTDPTERARLWQARHDVGPAVTHMHVGKTLMSTDVCVPVGELPAAMRFAQDVMESGGFVPSALGHVGDGNFHTMFLVDESDPEQVVRVAEGKDAIVRDALARGGTCSGEHGIGAGKMHYLELEHGDLLPFMRQIKGVFDPNGILNPGKIFSPEP